MHSVSYLPHHACRSQLVFTQTRRGHLGSIEPDDAPTRFVDCSQGTLTHGWLACAWRVNRGRGLSDRWRAFVEKPGRQLESSPDLGSRRSRGDDATAGFSRGD